MKIPEQPLRVCYFGTYRANYSRNEIMIEGLRCNDVHVIECQESLWFGVEDREALASGGWRNLGFWIRVVRTYLRLLAKYRKIGYYDILIVGYPGQIDVFLARLLSWLRRKPMVWDVFMSIYLIALERSLDQRSWFTVNLIRKIESLALRLPDLLIQDTKDYVAWLHDTHGVSSEKFDLVPTGADDSVFHPIPQEGEEDGCFRVIYYGTFIPNHGVEYIIEAARLLILDQAIRIELIGTGPDLGASQEIAQGYGLTNVIFIDWLEKSELASRVARSDVCLGVFGTTPQSLMTIQNKIYEGLAMRKPVITGDAPMIRETFIHGKHVYLCERANPHALAEAIMTLKNNPKLREVLASEGNLVFKNHFTVEKVGEKFAQLLSSIALK